MLFDGTCRDWDSVTLAELPGVTLILAWLEKTKDIVLKGSENVRPFQSDFKAILFFSQSTNRHERNSIRSRDEVSQLTT